MQTGSKLDLDSRTDQVAVLRRRIQTLEQEMKELKALLRAAMVIA